MINAPKHMKNLDIERDVIYMPPNARLDKKDSLHFKHLRCKKIWEVITCLKNMEMKDGNLQMEYKGILSIS
jgi:hypothetical protein